MGTVLLQYLITYDNLTVLSHLLQSPVTAFTALVVIILIVILSSHAIEYLNIYIVSISLGYVRDHYHFYVHFKIINIYYIDPFGS